MNLKKSIEEGLKRKGETKAWLGRELGVSRQYVARLTAGDVNLSWVKIKHISMVFGVPASEFIKWGEE